MLRIGICEDEPADLAHLREVMEGVLAELEMAAITESFNSGERLLAAIHGTAGADTAAAGAAGVSHDGA